MNTHKKLLFYCLLVALLTGSIFPSANEESTSCTDKQQEVWINFFVHGIMSIKPHLSLSNFIRFMTDDVQNTVYASTVELMRADPVFHQNQPMQDIGLKEIDPHDVSKGNASSATALVFEKMSSFAHAGNPPKNYYYTFGWSGLLSPTARYNEAIKLYKAVASVADDFKAQGIPVKIRIMGYSHGGNVLLNMALARQKNPSLPPLTINELILLGMPVQQETDYLVNDPMFEKIIHIYSRGDRIQKLDFFSFNRFFSRRLFKKRKGFDLPEKLIQIQLKCTRNATCTNDHTTDLYNFRSSAIVSGKSRSLRDASPGHTELWFFGWTPGNYRCNFPLYPLPAAALIPLIAREVEHFEEKRWFEKPTLIDIRPEQEIVLIRNQQSKKVITIAEFLTREQLRSLGELVLRYKPDNYTQELYTEHIALAYNQALEMHKDDPAQRRLAKKKRRCKNKEHFHQCAYEC